MHGIYCSGGVVIGQLKLKNGLRWRIARSVSGSVQRVDSKWLPLSGLTTLALFPSDRPLWLAWQHCNRCEREQNPLSSDIFFMKLGVDVTPTTFLTV